MRPLPNDKKRRTDSQLLADYQRSKDNSALDALFLRYSHLVFGLCRKYLDDDEESKDAVMEIFENLIDVLEKQSISHFRAWLYTVTKNHCLQKIRKSRKACVVYAPGEKIDLICMENSVSLHLNYGIDGQIDALEEALNRLNENQRTCLELFYREKKSYREIATMLGMEVKQVKSHLQNGKRNLKNRLSTGQEDGNG